MTEQSPEEKKWEAERLRLLGKFNRVIKEHNIPEKEKEVDLILDTFHKSMQDGKIPQDQWEKEGQKLLDTFQLAAQQYRVVTNPMRVYASVIFFACVIFLGIGYYFWQEFAYISQMKMETNEETNKKQTKQVKTLDEEIITLEVLLSQLKKDEDKEVRAHLQEKIKALKAQKEEAKEKNSASSDEKIEEKK